MTIYASGRGDRLRHRRPRCVWLKYLYWPLPILVYQVACDEHMPLVVGPTRINGSRLPWRTVAMWIHHLLAGLGLLHAGGYIHRDVKSENCLISTDASGDRLIPVDFGLARTVEPRGTSEVIGSINYMAPERVTDMHVDARSDLYSVGVVLFEALTRRLPFPGVGQDAVIRLHANEPP